MLTTKFSTFLFQKIYFCPALFQNILSTNSFQHFLNTLLPALFNQFVQFSKSAGYGFFNLSVSNDIFLSSTFWNYSQHFLTCCPDTNSCMHVYIPIPIWTLYLPSNSFENDYNTWQKQPYNTCVWLSGHASRHFLLAQVQIPTWTQIFHDPPVYHW